MDNDNAYNEYSGSAEGATELFGGLEDGEFTGGGFMREWTAGHKVYAGLELGAIVLLILCFIYGAFFGTPPMWLSILTVVTTGIYIAAELSTPLQQYILNMRV